MPTNPQARWLLPRWQTEYPARAALPESTLHGRREATFLVLVAMFFVAMTALLVLGTSHVIDVTALGARLAPALHLPIAVTVPLAALPFAVSLVASALVCQLFGRRRASAMIGVAVIASAGVVGLLRLAEVIDGGHAPGTSIALAAGFVLGHATAAVVCDALCRDVRGGRLFVRLNIASLVAHAIGWGAFAGVLSVGAGYFVAPIAPETIIALSIGGAASSMACVLVLSLPMVIAAHALAIALRVGGDEFAIDEVEQSEQWTDSGPAFAEGSVSRPLPTSRDDEAHWRAAYEWRSREDQDDRRERAAPERRSREDQDDRRERAAREPNQPFSSAEMRFFTEGDAAS